MIKNFEVLAPTSEKSPNNIIPIDTYFLEHPEENYLTVMKKSESRDRESPVPGVTPPLAQSTNSFKSEVGGGVAAQSKPAGTHRKVSPLKQFLRIKTTGQSKQEFPTRETLELGPIAKVKVKCLVSTYWMNQMK